MPNDAHIPQWVSLIILREIVCCYFSAFRLTSVSKWKLYAPLNDFFSTIQINGQYESFPQPSNYFNRCIHFQENFQKHCFVFKEMLLESIGDLNVSSTDFLLDVAHQKETLIDKYGKNCLIKLKFINEVLLWSWHYTEFQMCVEEKAL